MGHPEVLRRYEEKRHHPSSPEPKRHSGYRWNTRTHNGIAPFQRIQNQGAKESKEMDLAINIHPLLAVAIVAGFITLRITRVELKSVMKKKTKSPF